MGGKDGWMGGWVDGWRGGGVEGMVKREEGVGGEWERGGKVRRRTDVRVLLCGEGVGVAKGAEEQRDRGTEGQRVHDSG